MLKIGQNWGKIANYPPNAQQRSALLRTAIENIYIIRRLQRDYIRMSFAKIAHRLEKSLNPRSRPLTPAMYSKFLCISQGNSSQLDIPSFSPGFSLPKSKFDICRQCNVSLPCIFTL